MASSPVGATASNSVGSPPDESKAGPATPASSALDKPWKYLGSFLDNADQAHLPRAAVIARVGRAGVTPTTMLEAAPTFDAKPGEAAVIEEALDLIRIVDDAYGVRFALYVERSDLQVDRTRRRVMLAPEPGGARATPSVELAGGAAIKPLERRADWVQVEYDDQGLSLRGWLRTSFIGPVFERADFDLARVDDDVHLGQAVDVLEKPHGPVLARLQADSDDSDLRRRIQRVGQEMDGFVELEVVTPRARAHGFAPATAIGHKDSLSLGGIGGGGAWGASHTLWLDAPENTLIHVTPDGPIFAMTIDEFNLLILPGQFIDGWVEVRFETPWRRLSGWVECPALRQVDGRSTRFACTTADDPRRIESLPTW